MFNPEFRDQIQNLSLIADSYIRIQNFEFQHRSLSVQSKILSKS